VPLDAAEGLRPLALHRQRDHARGCERIVAGSFAPPSFRQFRIGLLQSRQRVWRGQRRTRSRCEWLGGRR
jgi:hypothetical protein